MTPLAKLYLRREKIVSRNCDDEFLQALQLEVSDDAEEQDTRGGFGQLETNMPI